MGRKEHKRSHKEHGSRRSGESKEERLLRKAKEFVRKESSKKSHSSRERREERSDDSGEDRENRKKDRHWREGERDRRSRDRNRDRKSRKHSSSREEKRHSRSRRRSRSDYTSGSDSERTESSRDRPSRKKRRRKGEGRNDETESKKKKKLNRTLPNKNTLCPLGNPRGSPPSTLLDSDNDYFAYHEHLWVYLYRDEGIAFNDLTSEKSREAFHRFVKKYNRGDLEAAYYNNEGLPAEAVQQCKTTRHSWTFKTTETERKGLQLLQEGVRKQTEYAAGASTSEATKEAPLATHHKGHGIEEEEETHRRTKHELYQKERIENRRLREHVRTTMLELSGGRKEGKERQIEKRKEKAQQIHGSARDRMEAQASGIELTDDAIYGGGGDGELSFQAALAKERTRTASREKKKVARIQELQQKEQDKQENMLKMLGLSGIQPGQKITIAPRKDG